MSSFEKIARQALSRLRREHAQGQDQGTVMVGYADTDGTERALAGDADAIYAHAIGRASSSGTSDVQVSAGEAQRLLVDLDGKLWVNSSPAPSSVQMVEGDIAHDVNDPITSNPVKTGGHANAALRAAVGENDRVDASYTLQGQARAQLSGPNGDAEVNNVAGLVEADILQGVHDPTVGSSTGAAVVTDAAGTLQQYLRGLVSRASTAAQGLFAVGNVAHDDVDSNNPVKIGGRAVASLDTGIPGGVAVGDRTDLAATITGLLGVAAVGTVASGSADAGNPLKVGGIGLESAPALVTDADRVNAYFDTAGRQQINQEGAIAGENLVGDYLQTIRAKLAIEQGSWDLYNSGNATASTGAVIKSGAGRLSRITGLAASAVQTYLLIIDNSSVALGTILWRSPLIQPSPDGWLEVSFSDEDGLYCATGIAFAISTSPTTISAPAAGWYVHAAFK